MTRLPFSRTFLFQLIFCLPLSLSFAQTESSVPETNQTLFAPINWPAPSPQRTAQGTPGNAYWQQQTDYNIAVSLDPFTHRVEGSVSITYTNNSPQSLNQLWIQLDQNAFASTSRNARLHGEASRWRGSFSEGGFEISDVTVSRKGNLYTPEYIVTDTRLRIALDNPLPAAGSVVDVTIRYSYVVPEFGADRTGRMAVENGTVYQIAQWYPRMHVYDDVSGWNAMPYLGQGEFYTEYGDYNFEITVPSDFVVVATGELLNADEVYTGEQLKRLERARQSSETIHIIKEREVGRDNSRPEGSPLLTWKFRAENVRDVAWGASQAFILDAAGWENVLVMSAYPQEALGTADNPGWERSTEYVRHAIQFYSNAWYRYPYPVAINVAGFVGGMEYPMLVFCDFQTRGQALFGVTDHEFGHTWFPMIVGSDERRHAWMDEGFTTFINYFSNIAFYGPQAERLQRYAPERTASRMQEPIATQPTMTYPDQIHAPAVGFLSYRKPAVGLLLLRNYILGAERFDLAFKSYIKAWAYKHPQPADFFRTIEQESGENLAWFWNGWFYGTEVLDQQISVKASTDTDPVLVVQHGTDLLFPVDIEIEFEDGSTTSSRIPIEAFFKQDGALVTPVENKRMVRVTIDPSEQLPDVNRSNNMWRR